jgi:[ribosomal protein S18]-alanine N-acetyltransferase
MVRLAPAAGMSREAPIRPAGPLDAGALAAIHAASFRGAEAWGPDAISLQLALPAVFGLLHPAGGMVLGRVTAEQAEVLTLAVAPPTRRRGIGTALLQSAMQEAVARGAAALFLEVSGANEVARAMYARAGFADVGRRRRYYADGSDALVMRAALIPPCAARGG